VPRIERTPAAFDPPSKVSAIALSGIGSVDRSWPARRAGTWQVAALAVPVADGLVVADGVLLAEGVVLVDGVLVADGVLLGVGELIVVVPGGSAFGSPPGTPQAAMARQRLDATTARRMPFGSSGDRPMFTPVQRLPTGVPSREPLR